MEQVKTTTDVLFILLGAVMVLAMHAGFCVSGARDRP